MNQLEKGGFIEKYVALLNPEKINLHLSGFLFVGLDKHTPQKMKNFEANVKKIPEVMECYLITGQSADYVLKVIVSDMQHYQKFLLERITQMEGVTSVHTSFVLQKIVDKTMYSLEFA